MTWISCEENLPEESFEGEILAYGEGIFEGGLKQTKVYLVTFFYKGFSVAGMETPHILNITHWMPIPKPPIIKPKNLLVWHKPDEKLPPIDKLIIFVIGLEIYTGVYGIYLIKNNHGDYVRHENGHIKEFKEWRSGSENFVFDSVDFWMDLPDRPELI